MVKNNKKIKKYIKKIDNNESFPLRYATYVLYMYVIMLATVVRSLHYVGEVTMVDIEAILEE